MRSRSWNGFHEPKGYILKRDACTRAARPELAICLPHDPLREASAP